MHLKDNLVTNNHWSLSFSSMFYLNSSRRAANRKKHLQIKKTLSSIWQRTCSQHNQKRNALQIKCIWLCCEHLQCFCICLCCEHLHHLLSKWWKCFLNLLFLFACVFWSCTALSSLGHRRISFWLFISALRLATARFSLRRPHRERCLGAGQPQLCQLNESYGVGAI